MGVSGAEQSESASYVHQIMDIHYSPLAVFTEMHVHGYLGQMIAELSPRIKKFKIKPEIPQNLPEWGEREI